MWPTMEIPERRIRARYVEPDINLIRQWIHELAKLIICSCCASDAPGQESIQDVGGLLHNQDYQGVVSVVLVIGSF